MPEVTTRFLPPFRYVALFAFWFLFLVWMVIATLNDLNDLADVSQSGHHVPPSYATALLSLDVWALIAALIVGLFAFNPFRWLNGKRLIFGCMALAVVLGRLSSGWFTYLLLLTPIPPVLVVIAMPFMLLFSGLGIILSFAVMVGLLFGFLVIVPVTLFNQLFEFERELTRYRYSSRGLAGYIVRATHWLRNEPLPAALPDEDKGARFATGPEIVALHNPVPDSMAFGHLGSPFFVRTDKHVLVMASTRSGKGVSLIIPHLLRYQGSAFVLDPKGENAKATGRRRATLNGKVHYLDPFGVSGKPQSRYNPLSRFTADNMEAESKALAAAMFVVEPQQRDHWSDSGQQLLAALILYVYLTPTIEKAQKDLPTVRKILLGALREALEEMKDIDGADGLLRVLAISFIRTPEKEFGSIVSTTRRQTEILDNPFMQACLAASGDAPEVDFTDWLRGTMTVYLCLAAPKFPTFNRWLRLVLTSALDTMTERLNPPRLPVCFMLDELATLGRLPTVENAVGLSAGYGIQLVTVFQDVAQMRALYEKRWASFVGNAGVRALFNLDDFESADYWSRFMGNRVVETSGRHEDRYGLSEGRNVGETMRPLLSTDRLMIDFAAGKMLVLAQGSRPVVTSRVPYYGDNSLAGLWDDPRVATRPVVTATAKAVLPSGPGAAAARNGAPPQNQPSPPHAGPPSGKGPTAAKPQQGRPQAGGRPLQLSSTITGHFGLSENRPAL